MSPAASGSVRAAGTVPASAIERLVRNLEQFAGTAQQALAASPKGAEHTRWAHACSLLQEDLARLRAAQQHAAAGDPIPLRLHAGALRLLARRMDGYRLDFAGPAWAQKLTTARRLLVLSAWQVYDAGSTSGAAGR